ncbi:MAG: hypothetical protein M3Y34_00085 [Actinomycetota bacterium]|nr:hypothetical protein [Actinomycetota bacterium]
MAKPAPKLRMEVQTMSRYTLTPRVEQHEVVVGWDPPLRQFFAQVFDARSGDDNNIILWEDYPSVDALADSIFPYAGLPDATREKLAADSGRPARQVGPVARPERVRIHGVNCSVDQVTHPLGGNALLLYIGEGEGRELYALPTAYLADARLAPDEVLVKDYSENAGMLAALIEAGVVVPTGRSIRSGYVELHVVTLTECGP